PAAPLLCALLPYTTLFRSQGRLASGLLLFQDLCVVPMMLLLPVLAGSGQDSIFFIVWVLAKSLITLVAIVWTARKLLPRLLHQVDRKSTRLNSSHGSISYA